MLRLSWGCDNYYLFKLETAQILPLILKDNSLKMLIERMLNLKYFAKIVKPAEEGLAFFAFFILVW